MATKLSYYGHACFSVGISGKTLLFDPFISPNPATTGKVDVNNIPADFILLSHGHADHVADAVSIAQRTGAKIICNYEIYEWLSKQGITNTHPLNHGGGHNFDFGRAHFTSAIHSSVLPDGTYGGNPGGFLITSKDSTFYYSGDTALTYDMKLIAETAQIDFAVLCIGDNFTMGPKDAAKAAQWVGAKTVVGVHFDTFAPIQIDHQAALAEFEKADVKLILPEIGQSYPL